MISSEQVAELVRLYSEFHGAIDPTEPAVLRAEEAFIALLRSLHSTHAVDVPFQESRRYAVQQCKLYLRKN
ncbi:MAG: hypothetical protein HYY24_22425 [Verrucomicrobia bacterium]|nr:hypothetical protein [Verrucomicrobiota bacterium]